MLVLSIVRATLDHGSLACLLQQCSVIFVINFLFLHERWIIIVTRNDKNHDICLPFNHDTGVDLQVNTLGK